MAETHDAQQFLIRQAVLPGRVTERTSLNDEVVGTMRGIGGRDQGVRPEPVERPGMHFSRIHAEAPSHAARLSEMPGGGDATKGNRGGGSGGGGAPVAPASPGDGSDTFMDRCAARWPWIVVFVLAVLAAIAAYYYYGKQ